MDKTAIREAVARGWCYKAQAMKVFDPALAEAIAKEVEKLIPGEWLVDIVARDGRSTATHGPFCCQEKAQEFLIALAHGRGVGPWGSSGKVWKR